MAAENPGGAAEIHATASSRLVAGTGTGVRWHRVNLYIVTSNSGTPAPLVARYEGEPHAGLYTQRPRGAGYSDWTRPRVASTQTSTLHASLICLEPTDTLSDTLWRG